MSAPATATPPRTPPFWPGSSPWAAAVAAALEPVPGAAEDVLAGWERGADERTHDRGRAVLEAPLATAPQTQLAECVETALATAAAGVAWWTALDRAVAALAPDDDDPAVVDTGLAAPLDAVASVVALVADAGALLVLDAARRLEDVAAISPAVSSALDTWMELWGTRLLVPDPAEPTLGERPRLLLDALQEEARRPHRWPRAGGIVSANLRRALVARDQADAAGVGLALAGLRRAGLHAASRLGFARLNDVFELPVVTVVDALRSDADRGELRRRAETARQARARPAPRPDDLVGLGPGARLACPSIGPAWVIVLPRIAVLDCAATAWSATAVACRQAGVGLSRPT
jgi:hypothetical protein